MSPTPTATGGTSFLAGAAVARHGGRYLVPGPDPEVFEGDLGLRRVVIVEFESRDQAHRFWESPGYRRARGKGEGAAVFDAALLAGQE